MFSMFFRNLLVMFFLTNSAHIVQIAPLREREKRHPQIIHLISLGCQEL